MTAYLELEDAYYIISGFTFHVRDAGLLGSALARPATTLNGVDVYTSLALKAGALLESLTRNHSLFDGNERTGWTLVVAFLRLNGHRHNFNTDEAFGLVVGIASGHVGLDESAQRIHAHLVRL